MAELRSLSTAEEAAHAAAELVASHAGEASQARGSFTVALTGGSTPQPLYQALPAAPLPGVAT